MEIDIKSVAELGEPTEGKAIIAFDSEQSQLIIKTTDNIYAIPTKLFGC